MECLQMFGGLNRGSFNEWLPSSTPISLSNIVCMPTMLCSYKTICDILRKKDVDDNDEVTYHAASSSCSMRRCLLAPLVDMPVDIPTSTSGVEATTIVPI
jgi:hypothetical protein